MSSLLAINIGNTRISLGVFASPAEARVPEPRSAVSLPWASNGAFAPDFDAPQDLDIAVIASVNPPRRDAVAAWIRERFSIEPLDFPRDVSHRLDNRCQPPVVTRASSGVAG